jgi:hypothetical protein
LKKTVYIVVISGIKCEYAVQLSRGEDWFIDNIKIHAESGSGAESSFKVRPGAEKNHSGSTTLTINLLSQAMDTRSGSGSW